MKIQYFADTDPLYIEFRPVRVTETRDLDENTTLDLDERGEIAAITVEHASDRGRNGRIPPFSHDHPIFRLVGAGRGGHAPGARHKHDVLDP